MLFRDRADAAHRLAARLRERLAPGAPTVVLGIPRGGVLVAAPVARELGATLDVIVPRKIGAPGDRELAVGAIALAGREPITVFDDGTVRALGVSDEYLRREIDAQTREIERRVAAYRTGEPVGLRGRRVLLVDDGLATGLTARAAAGAVKTFEPAELLIAVPVAPEETVAAFAADGLRVIAVETPSPFLSVGRFYDDFHDVSDEEVRTALLR